MMTKDEKINKITELSNELSEIIDYHRQLKSILRCNKLVVVIHYNNEMLRMDFTEDNKNKSTFFDFIENCKLQTENDMDPVIQKLTNTIIKQPVKHENTCNIAFNMPSTK